MTLARVTRAVVALVICASLFACTESVRIGEDLPAGGSATSSAGTASDAAGSNSGGSAGSDAGSAACIVTACQGKVYACGDCVDNDGDGLIDSADPECTGACDNTEDSFFGGIPGANNAPCHEDCYFDQNSGSGDDDCYWNQACDALSVAPDYPPSADSHCAYDANANTPGTSSSCAELELMQTPACLDFCLPLTPNGCDCFGCCELPADSNHFVWLGSANGNDGTCTLSTLDDPSACHPCTPVSSCFNACDACEVCVGRTSPAPSCTGNAGARCAPNVPACGQPGEPACADGAYCVTGCCQFAPK
ncbi:MAG TPA: hypothetical protein VHV51_03380 [Polyangiaceae bacterium]|jgi:hypothetical protein|nr:hypothetical protein [Polyangiaceae bacterium]